MRSTFRPWDRFPTHEWNLPSFTLHICCYVGTSGAYYIRNNIRYLRILFDPGQESLASKSNHEKTSAVACDNLSLSSHISTFCLMEACNIVLIFTLLFSIKGQTVQNSTVIPRTLCLHFTPVSFYTALPCNCIVFTSKLSTRKLQVQRLFALKSVFICFRSVNYMFTAVLSPPTANQKAAPGAGRLSGEGGDPDVSAVCQCEFVYFKRRRQNSRLICMTTCCRRAFMGSVVYRSSGRNINLWDAH